MSINLFEKFSPKLDERYKLASRTDVACGNDFDWEGANSIKVLTLMNPTLNDYQVGNGSPFQHQHLWRPLFLWQLLYCRITNAKQGML